MIDRRAFFAGGLGSLLIARPDKAKASLTTRHGFNDAEIDWQLFDAGRKIAQRDKKPMFVLAHTTWCPHCVAYRKIFFDAKIVAKMQAFVPVIIDRDIQSKLSAQFAPDGDYIPRTMFFDSKARLITKLRFRNAEFNYFVDYSHPRHLRNYMTRASKYFR